MFNNQQENIPVDHSATLRNSSTPSDLTAESQPQISWYAFSRMVSYSYSTFYVFCIVDLHLHYVLTVHRSLLKIIQPNKHMVQLKNVVKVHSVVLQSYHWVVKSFQACQRLIWYLFDLSASSFPITQSISLLRVNNYIFIFYTG